MTSASRRRLLALPFVGLVLIVHADPLRAQSRVPMACAAARDLLLTDGGNRTDVVLASRRIVRCGDMAPTTLISALRNATAGSLRDTVVREASWHLSDRRLLDSVIVLSRDLHLTPARRTIALGLLTHYADSLASLAPLGLNDPLKVVIDYSSHGGYILGNQPLASLDHTRALAAIRAVSQNEPDFVVRGLAELASQQLVRTRSLAP